MSRVLRMLSDQGAAIKSLRERLEEVESAKSDIFYRSNSETAVGISTENIDLLFKAGKLQDWGTKGKRKFKKSEVEALRNNPQKKAAFDLFLIDEKEKLRAKSKV